MDDSVCGDEPPRLHAPMDGSGGIVLDKVSLDSSSISIPSLDSSQSSVPGSLAGGSGRSASHTAFTTSKSSSRMARNSAALSPTVSSHVTEAGKTWGEVDPDAPVVPGDLNDGISQAGVAAASPSAPTCSSRLQIGLGHDPLSNICLRLPRSSQKLASTPDYPVRGITTGLPVGSCSTDDASLVPDSGLLPASSGFQISSSNFPPLLAPSNKSACSADVERLKAISTPPSAAVDHVSKPPSGCSTPPLLSPNSSVPHGVSCDLNKAKGKHPPDWASLLKESPSSMQLKFIKPEIITTEGKVTIKLPSSVALQGTSIWKNTMVGFFLDKLPFSLVQASAMKHWGKFGLLNVLSNDNGFFFFNFPDSGSLDKALEGGPWHFGGRPIFLKRWSSCMNLSKEGCRKVPIWAHFYNVPLEFWTEDGLSYIASMVGKPLHADKLTTSLRRLSYARICIEIDINDSLPDAFDIELEDGSVAGIQIAYNWIPKRCSICKVFGHLSSNCKKAGHQVWIPKPAHPIASPLRDGEWKTVNSNRKAKPGNPPLSSKAKHVSVSMSQAENSNHAADDPIAAVVDQIAAAVDPSGTGAGDPFASDDPNAFVIPIAISSASPVGNRSGLLRCPEGSDFAPKVDPLSHAALPSLKRSTSYSDCAPNVVSSDPADLSLESKDQMGISAAPNAVGSSCSLEVSSTIGCEDTSPLSSPSCTPLLARKLIMVDEVDRKQGKKKKGKQRSGSSSHSRGNSSLHS